MKTIDQIKLVWVCMLVFLAISIPAQAATYTLKQDCKGPLNFDIEPSSISPNGNINFIASGLTDCKGRTIEFYETNRKTGGGSPMPNVFAGSCASEPAGCAISFTAPSSERNYDYFAKLVKSGGDIYSGTKTLEVKKCSLTAPSKELALGNGCKVSVEPYGQDIDDISLGRWKDSSITANSITTTFDDKTSGGCDGDLAFSTSWETSTNWISISNDRISKRGCGLFGLFCPNDLAYGFKLSIADAPDTECSILKKPSECVVGGTQYSCPIAFPGIKTTIAMVKDTASFQTQDFTIGECLENDLGDTSTACTNIYSGLEKPVCDTGNNMCIPLAAPCKSSDPNSMCAISCSTSSIQTVSGEETAVIGNTKGYWKLTTKGKNKVTFLDNPASTLDPILQVGKSVNGKDVCDINAKSSGSETCQKILDEGTYYIKIDHAGTTSGKDSVTVTCQRLLAPPILKSPKYFATLSDSTPTLTWERNNQNTNDANYYQWYIGTIDESAAQAALAGRGGIFQSFSSSVSKTTPILNPGTYLWSAAQGKETITGSKSFSEYADPRILTLCGTCSSSKDLGAINHGGTVSGSTCYLSSSAQDDIFRFTVNKRGYLKVDMFGPVSSGFDEWDFAPSSCDWDFWVNANSFFCGSEITYITTSGTDVKCDDSATISFPVLTGDKYIKVHRNSGDGSGNINVKLLECVAKNALDLNCPSIKPYCSNNKCVECWGNDLTYLAGDPTNLNTANDRSSQCPANAPRCRSPDLYTNPTYTCIVPDPCSSNPDCPASMCCTADSSLGGYADRLGTGQCKSYSSLRGENKFLCT